MLGSARPAAIKSALMKAPAVRHLGQVLKSECGFSRTIGAGDDPAGGHQAFLVEQVAGAFEKQHAEDVFLVLAGVHVAAQCIARGHEQIIKAGEGSLAVIEMNRTKPAL